ncbi:MAG: D-alanyl-D-alanine carboxypeptidase [Clostridiaceae bacterium]|jgi:D-alanyl-D-alanine carboxypeptidase (penicillin-binding protein 5/6)|nr:D-alanyl-D-alanine carboxypeptidase [Clostridiaceae bacterium]
MEMMKLNYFVKASSTILLSLTVFLLAIQNVYADKSLQVKAPVINAQAAVVVEESSGRVLYEKNANQKRSIASTTKIMTAIVALENADVDEEVIISKRAAGIGGSAIGLQSGQKFTLREMLYALLMASANDAAIAIAEHIGGTVEDFSKMMNIKAASLGMDRSNFVSPHGLDRDNQYSTAYDMALITIEALKNPLFAEIVSTKSSYIPGHNLYNTNELLGSCPGVDGVKTGYTGKAGRCLVTTVKRGDMRLISVVLGSPTNTARANASRDLIDYCYESFSMHKLLNAGDVYAEVPVYRGIEGCVSLKADENIVMPLSKAEVEILKMNRSVPELLNAPVYAGTDTGFIEYEVSGRVLAGSILKVSKDIRRKTMLDYLKDVLYSWGKVMREGMFSWV